MRRHELCGSVQRSARLVEYRDIALEDVGYPRGDLERDLDVGAPQHDVIECGDGDGCRHKRSVGASDLAARVR